jgi:hypothetical protein
MSERPRTPEELPAGNGHSGPAAAASPPAASPPAASPPADDRHGALSAILASRWAVILRRFRDYMHQP